MKQKTFFAILSLLMLSLSSFAQAPVKGDVNEDGKVDEDDISAIIEIIKNGQNQPTYYWYAGNDIQQNTSTITVATGTNPGWRKIDKSVENVAQYTSSNPLWHGLNNPINTGVTAVGCYCYLPKEYVDAGLGVYTNDGTAILDNLYQKTSRQTITINSVIYYEYFKSGVSAQFDGIIYKK